ncbi:MAG: hypothetical protein HOO93_15720 [Methyloglobulus sp.]|nr:hypothetical protein [Methyloglobulus sp.]
MRILTKLFLALLLVVTALPTCLSSPAQAQQKPPAAGAAYPLAENVAKMGAFSCAARANQIAQFLGGAPGEILILDNLADNFDRRLIHATLLIPEPDGRFASAEITLAPNQANGCGTAYQISSYADQSCEKAAQERFPKLKFMALGKTELRIAKIDNHARILAKPMGDGCLLTKSEIVQ